MRARERRRLDGKVALVAGATRGAGRGIACMLGEAGATVYCTGRSVRGQPPSEGPYAGRPETIEETAEMVIAAGGKGIAVRVDHLVPEEVRLSSPGSAASRAGSMCSSTTSPRALSTTGSRSGSLPRQGIPGAAAGRPALTS